jgi:hypothetical protein
MLRDLSCRIVVLAAAAATQALAAPALSNPPELIDLVPASGPAGTAYPLQVTIRGTGFSPTGNIVNFGPVKISGVEPALSDRMTFAVPKLMPARSEAPPLVLPPGEYSVTVTTASGTSNALTFRLTRGP